MTQRSGRKRLAVDIPEVLHEGIKSCARTRNITITRWILRAINERFKKETKYDPKDHRKSMPEL